MERIEFELSGHVPAAQGSFVALKSRNPNDNRLFVKADNETELRAWRYAVQQPALAAMAGLEPLSGPLQVTVLFTIGERPASRRGEVYPATARQKDIDKLARALFDAIGGGVLSKAGRHLTTSGPVIADDGLIVRTLLDKRWCGLAGGAAEPGVRVVVEAMPVEALVGMFEDRHTRLDAAGSMVE